MSAGEERAGDLARVTVRTRRLWVLRLVRETPRHLLAAAAVLGLLASARFAIAPPQPAARTDVAPAPPLPDRAGEAFATLFARRYLTWSAAAPDAGALEPFMGVGMEPDAGLELPSTGSQRVEWAEVIQARERAPGNHVYTVAAQTDAAGLIYLTVGVRRTAEGALALTGYPAFVGPPATDAATRPASLPEVTDPSLVAVVERGLRNYLASSQGELAADLAPGAHVSVPPNALALESIQRPYWSEPGTVLAVLQARDARGAQYTLDYEVDVSREQGRWEISAVQMNPRQP